MPTCSAMFFHITNSTSAETTPNAPPNRKNDQFDQKDSNKLKTRVKNIMFLKTLQAVSEQNVKMLVYPAGTMVKNLNILVKNFGKQFSSKFGRGSIFWAKFHFFGKKLKFWSEIELFQEINNYFKAHR